MMEGMGYRSHLISTVSFFERLFDMISIGFTQHAKGHANMENIKNKKWTACDDFIYLKKNLHNLHICCKILLV